LTFPDDPITLSAMKPEEINQRIKGYFTRVTGALAKIDCQKVQAALNMLLEVYQAGGTVYLFGNGGSAANASHLYCDLTKSVSYGRQKRFSAVCLSENVPAMMAYANDFGWGKVFVGPLENTIRAGDLVIGFSCSGNSVNVINAIEYARDAGARTIALCGNDGGKIKPIADLSLHVESRDVKVVEDVHLILCHCIKELLVEALDTPAAT
jgi:D-sedoheptulose 7-phosphate isomerase